MKKYLTHFSSFLLIAIAGLCLSSCKKGNGVEKDGQNHFLWKKIGLNGLKVNKLVSLDNFLYAATEDGIYKKDINQQGAFEPIGLQGKNIETILVFDQNEIIASVADFKANVQIDLFKTINAAQSWERMKTNFGGNFEPHILREFLRPSDPSNIIYATGNHLLAKSEDKGTTWTPIWGDWDKFGKATSAIAINPLLPDEIWLGGQGGVEDGYLVRLQNGIEKNRWVDLVPGPTTVKKILFDKQTPQSIYVGFEGGLLKTSNNGQSWQTLIDEHKSSRFFYGVNISKLHNNKIYAAGLLKGNDPQPLMLYYSTDKGVTWNQDVFKGEAFGGVKDMLLKTEGNKERLFLALVKGGVYEVTVQN